MDKNLVSCACWSFISLVSAIKLVVDSNTFYGLTTLLSVGLSICEGKETYERNKELEILYDTRKRILERR